MDAARSLFRALRAAGLLIASVVLLDGARDARAAGDEAASKPAPLEALLAAVKSPASEESVRKLLAQPEIQTGTEALRVAGALWHAGGPHAAEGLRTLARHADAPVREAALRGLAVLGLRVAAGARTETQLRRALDDVDPAVRRTAYEAVARVGVPDDVPKLIESLSHEEADVRSHALRSLRVLTGERFTHDQARWIYWWEHSREALETQVGLALGALEADVEELLGAHAWSILERRSWIARPLVDETARRWIEGWEPERRRDGYRLVTILRLAGLADSVLEAARHDKTGPVHEACLTAQRALGLLPPAE